MNDTPVSSTPSGAAPEATPVPTADGVRRIASKELLGTRGELVIEHHGRFYRLRVTQNDKLILTA